MVGDAEIRYIFVGEQLQYDVAFRVMLLGSQLKQIIIFDREVKRCLLYTSKSGILHIHYIEQACI